MLGEGGNGRTFSTGAASHSGFVGHPPSGIPCIVVIKLKSKSKVKKLKSISILDRSCESEESARSLG